jgi:hypothetical protein
MRIWPLALIGGAVALIVATRQRRVQRCKNRREARKGDARKETAQDV